MIITSSIAEVEEKMGVIGLPVTLAKLAGSCWDVIIIGGGHNGLTCACYLARAKKRVLLLEARERIGGACTLKELWPGYRVSPCAYLAGLLHPRVITELGLKAEGLQWTPASAGMFVPFDDGGCIQLWGDDCEQEIKHLAPRDWTGWQAMEQTKQRLRDSLRPDSENDLWLEPAPTEAMIMDRLKGDEECRKLLFEWSMAEFVESYLEDERLQIALLGQGVIGTNASPFDKGTASIHFHHASGRMAGQAGTWGFVKGGIGRVSFMLCNIAHRAGAVVTTGTPVTRILPGEGVMLVGGEKIHAPVVVSNADPVTTAELLGADIDSAWQQEVAAIPMTGCTVKLNIALNELPDFTARPGTGNRLHEGQINTPLTKDEWRKNCQTARHGDLPERLWTELYIQTVCDDSIAPPGKHLMSVFAQYVPYKFRKGNWATRRDEVGQLVIDSIARFTSNIPGAIERIDIKGPPDIEQEVGLKGGHIFQGECLPEYMWYRRLPCRTPMQGVYLCGAGTHPGGSVIAVNGRNAAMTILADAD